MIAYHHGASIEANSLSLKSRKYNLYPPEKHQRLSYLVFPFKLSIDAKAIIVKELIPKKTIIKSDSLLNLNDGIQGEIISGFTEKLGKRPKLAPGSSTHRARFVDTNGFSFAMLQREFRALLLMKNQSQIFNIGE